MDIKDFPLFRDLPAKAKQEICKTPRKLRFAQGETVIAKGSRIEFVYFMLSGRVKESTCTHSGKEIVFNMYARGDCFGLVWSLNLNHSNADFVATRDSEVYAIRINDFYRLMRANASVLQSVLAEFASIAMKFSEKLYEIRALDVSERTRAELLRYAASNLDAEDSDYVEIKNLPTHEEIANSIFTHREAVTREISNLRKTGVVIKTESNMLAANVGMLQKMVGEYS